ncbi:hypothetical protein [Aggregatibacter actinomycetemcomitans]|uniref:hypothetical protein n=1 Tax=Aggregatibacter actinomycetemcomitans TaxID=714 RepID=UPI001F121301|nr:hypothetical protein [Aggregatibacter actinomycetemcomitans]
MGKHYSIEFKHHIVKLVLEEHWGIREAAQHFILPPILPLSSGCNALKNTVPMDFTVNLTKREK